MKDFSFFVMQGKTVKQINLLFLSLTISVFAFSQQEYLMGRVNIASPTAASIGKYGDVPVSYHTGIPSISIPIHTLTSGSLQLPVSLSYHAGGLRVEENDSWVGAGWTLNAGGVITRTVKDKPDEKQTGSLSQTHGYFSDYGFAGTDKNQTDGSIAYPQYVDKEPDLFSFNFNGYSGKFYFNDDRSPLLIPEQDIKIEYNYTPGTWNGSPGLWSGNGRCIEGFKLTTPDGTKYYFGINPLTTISAPYCDPIEVTSTYASTTGSNYSQVITSWYLYKIESANGAHSITLNYEREKFAYYTYINNLNYKNTDNNNRYSLVKNYVAGARLSKVSSANGSIDFIPGSSRQDLSGWNPADVTNYTDYTNTSSKTLGVVQINNSDGSGFKKFTLNYNYFVDNTNQLPTYFQGWGIQYDTKRLKLLSLQEQSLDGTIINPPYLFEYFSESIVRRLSFAKDHWGFNNGAVSNSELYPLLSTLNGSLNSGMGLGNPANREATWPAMRGGSISKITYPTGGYTNFEFEPNKFYVNENNVNVDKLVGGLRVKSITNYDPTSNKSIVTNYSYVEGSGTLSSGILFSKPTYIQVFRNDWMRRFRYWGIGNDNGCLYPADASTIRDWTYLFSDNPLRPMETTQGYHIGYKEVKVSQTGNGYSIYRFYTGPTWPLPDRSGVAVTKVNNPGPCDINIPNLPAAPPIHDFKRGELVYEGHFNNSGQSLTEKNILNTYTISNTTVPGLLVSSQFSIGFEATFYEIQTARISESNIQEIIYQQPAGTSLTKQTQTFYESNYHHQPTKIITTDSRGITNERRLKYSFDYRVPIFENTTACNDAAANFMSYVNNLFNSSYQALFNTYNGYTDSRYNNSLKSFNTALFSARQQFINCRRVNYTNQYTSTTALNAYQTNHNQAKNNADAELKPILWMQDLYINAPIEVSEWKGNQLLGASYTKFSNLRDDEHGIYPEKILKIEPSSLSSTFQASAVSSNGTSITRDSRYQEFTTLDFNEGNIINSVGRDGVVASYGWSYNNMLPTVKAINASNKLKQIATPGAKTNSYSAVIGPSNGTCFDRQETFYQTAQGTITLSISSFVPPSATVTASYTLTGPNNYYQSGSLCKQSSGAGCSGLPTAVSFTNLPQGNYTISYSVCTPFQSYSFNSTFSYTYNGLIIVQSGLREFFVENFEENSSSVSGNSNTGSKYYNGNYTLNFSPSNYPTKSYKIQWWNLSGGKWIFNSQPYTNGMTITGPVDDIRIFPADAQLVSYTYNKSGQITSEINTNGYIQFYDYDLLGRLIVVRDKDKNIVKRLCYNLNGQAENCMVNTTAQWVSTGDTRCKPCPTNINYSTNILQERKLDINPNSSTYNTYQWFDVGVNSSCGLAVWQNEGSPFCELNGSGQNTGNQLQLQRDMNPCSPTYNTTQTVLIGYNISACPLPASCNTSNCTGEGYKCVYGSCEYGYRIYTASYYDYGSGMTVCVYHYEWSDGTWSNDYYEYNYGQVYCPIMSID